MAGEQVRYIDYENGDDTADGRSPETAWKRHPWDREAEGNAAAAEGPVTYVFKGGVAYRGQLLADESGEAGNPIRLTADPSWGDGHPWFLGSEQLPSDWVPATEVEAPARLPEPEKVWALDLKPTGLLEQDKQGRYRVAYVQPDGRTHWSPPGPSFTGLFSVDENGGTRMFHLASDPDWQPGDLAFAMSHWHKWDGPGKATYQGKELGGLQADQLKGKPADYFEGGRLWSQYPLFMGTAISSEIPATTTDKKTKEEVPFYIPEEGMFVKGLPGGVKKNVRYMIENLPQYLDNEGEFYLDAETGILYLRLAEDPNQLRLELTKDLGQIRIDGQSHIEIAGLQFGLASGDAVSVSGNASDITVRHCLFENVARNAFKATLGMSRQEPSTEELTNIVVRDNDFRNIWESGISISDGSGGSLHHPYGRLRHAEILRNRLVNLGFRHQGNVQSNIAALELLYPETGVVAGNLVTNTWGSGIVVFGGKEGNLGDYSIRRTEIPLIRVHVFHNLTQHCARAVNDYGGLALWQGGPLNAWSNNVGSSVGHMPGGFWGIPMTNLSYPLYLDGAYKVYSFNNLVWGATIQPDDPYRSRNSAYFMVFGFLNQFANNSVY
ncbi:MAG: right-handed parallel beta-helix repeat-containing protein, partial [Puniceicoccaceae bacterium]